MTMVKLEGHQWVAASLFVAAVLFAVLAFFVPSDNTQHGVGKLGPVCPGLELVAVFGGPTIGREDAESQVLSWLAGDARGPRRWQSRPPPQAA